MKIKLIAILLASALAVSCSLGFTCGKGENAEKAEGSEITGSTDESCGTDESGGTDSSDSTGGNGVNGGADISGGVNGSGSGNTSGDTGSSEDNENTSGDKDEKPDGGIEGGNGGVVNEYVFEKGEEVTAEEWAAAFAATLDLKNYTANFMNLDANYVTGNYLNDVKLPINGVEEMKTCSSLYYAFDKETVQLFIMRSDKLNGFSDLTSLEFYDPEIYDQLLELIWYNSDIRNFSDDVDESLKTNTYQVTIDGIDYKASFKDNETFWNVEAGAIYNQVIPMISLACSTEKGGELKPVFERYEDFVYSDGIYTADVWVEGVMPFKYSVSLKDGYILSVSLSVTKTQEEDGLTFTKFNEMGMTLVNIGGTDLTDSPEAVKAVEDYIAKNA
ncbi:MAG: hypothetical protein K2O89_04225 [Clostridia bacterium]|nr:hypothetical protein [Clostridia bacterium]